MHVTDLVGINGITRVLLVYTWSNVKVKQSRYTPWRRLGGEEIQLLLIHDLGTRWGCVVSVTPRPHFTLGERTPVPIVQEAGWAPEPVWT
jgi:hypothetical protein